MKTIKQIADEIGVSKQAVHKKRKSPALSTSLQPFTTTVDGVVYLSVDGENLIKSAFAEIERKPVDDNFNEVDDNVDGEVDGAVVGQNELYVILRIELDAKNRQIEALQTELAAERQHSREQADKLAVLADTAQRLHAGTIQKQLTGDTDPAEVEIKRKGLVARIFGSRFVKI